MDVTFWICWRKHVFPERLEWLKEAKNVVVVLTWGCIILILQSTAKYRYDKPVYNEVRSTLNYFLTPVIEKCMEKNLDTTKPHYREHTCILPVPWPFVTSRFHCMTMLASKLLVHSRWQNNTLYQTNMSLGCYMYSM